MDRWIYSAGVLRVALLLKKNVSTPSRRRILLTACAFVALVALAYGQMQPVESTEVRGPIAGGPAEWNPVNFGWFFYDLTEGVGGERLYVNPEGKGVEQKELIYECNRWSQPFKKKDLGSFHAVALFGKRYLAGYPDSNFTEEVSELEKGELRDILIDSDRNAILQQNDSLELADNCTLVLKGVTKEGDRASIQLLRDGLVVNESVVSAGDTFAAKVMVGGDEVPIVLAHILRAMDGSDGAKVEIDAVFQVRDRPAVVLSEDERIGRLEVTELSADRIRLQNYVDLSLSRNSVTLLAGGLVLRTIDQPELAYYPIGIIREFGLYDVRGTIFEGNDKKKVNLFFGPVAVPIEAGWDYTGFSGFYFDDEDNIGSELMILNGTSNRSLPSRYKVYGDSNSKYHVLGVEYQTRIQSVKFERRAWGEYNTFCFLGLPWFSGFSNKTSKEIGSKTMMEYNQLGKVVIDTSLSDIATAGNVYFLYDGYSLLIRDVSEDRIFVHLFKNGQQVDNSTIETNTTYIYKKDVGDAKDIPIVVLHVGEILKGDTDQVAVIDGLFQISDETYLPIDNGRRFGDMTIIWSTPEMIVMVNSENITLHRDSEVMLRPEIPGLWKGLGLKVADNATLRYYPFMWKYVVPSPMILRLDSPKEAVYGSAGFSAIVKAGDIRAIIADVSDAGGRSISIRNLAKEANLLPVGSGDYWSFDWSWNGTVPITSDDGSTVPGADYGITSAVLYLNESAQGIPVGVLFDDSGRIAEIADSQRNTYYVSRSRYNSSGKNYEEMLQNSTLRRSLIKIEPDVSRLGFYNFVNGTVEGQSNHTLTGSIEAIEPHIKKAMAPPGRYLLRLSVQNPMNTTSTGVFFQFAGQGAGPGSSGAIMPQSAGSALAPAIESALSYDQLKAVAKEEEAITVGNALAKAGENATIELLATETVGGRRFVELSYDPAMLEVVNISMPGSMADPASGRINVSFARGEEKASITFALKSSGDSSINVTDVYGMTPTKITNGSISSATKQPSEAGKSAEPRAEERKEGKEPKKSFAPGAVFVLGALAICAFVRRKIMD